MSDRWQWLKRYRVWEANRRTFQAPENWLEPEVRDEGAPPPRPVERSRLLRRRGAEHDPDDGD